jgi:alkanesulfonate monooxygenase SsuD/methylene tetrahydromethanopterin reductase-like flavin-dependent oxidoreductase (luciferase family)
MPICVPVDCQSYFQVPYEECIVKYGFIATFTQTMDETLALAELTERHGWDGFFTWDGISVGPMPTWDPWVTLGAVATRTSRVTLGAIVHPLSRRRPWKVVREALTVDHLSGGRLVIPVAMGAVDDGGLSRVHPEVTDLRERAARLDETLEIMKLAWRGESFSYEGVHYQMEDMVFQPTPVNGDIPIWVVGAWPSERSMGRAAKYEGVLPSLRGNTETQLGPEHIAEIKTWIAERRGDNTPFEIVMEGTTPGDDPNAIRRQLQPLADAGATWWIESMWEGGVDFDALKRRIEQGPPR